MKRAVDPAGVVLAIIAGVWHMMLMTSATNDNFLHLTLAQQMLAGDWPVRDFFDNAWILQYSLSAVAQWLSGNRLIGEAVVVGIAWAVSTWLVFDIVRRLSTAVPAAAAAALLPILAGARGYSYPKGIVYAVAAMLWWEYLRRPTRGRAVAFGAWTALAFYFRPDHGLYVAIGVVLAMVTAHGPTTIALSRCVVAGLTTIGLILPHLVYVQLTVGLPQYIQTGAVAAQAEHSTQGPHEWPLLRLRGQLFTAAPPDDYAPTIGIRWTAESTEETRQQLRARYDLTPVEQNGRSERVRLSERSIPKLSALLSEPSVEDSARVDRSNATIPESVWPAWDRWVFTHPWLRLKLFPSLDHQARASELVVAFFFLLPLATAAASVWLRTYLSPVVTAGGLLSFSIFVFAVDLAMLRHPFTARAPDAVVLSAILFGLWVAALWRSAAGAGRLRGAFLRTASVLMIVAVTVAVGGVGRFRERVRGFASQLQSVPPAQTDIYRELLASPPLAFYVDRPARFSVRLAAYVRECVPPADRVLVLWFEPEIYYYSERLAAQRHLVFAKTWASLEYEQQMSLKKIQRFQPPIALMRESSLDEYARASFPGVVEYVEREYTVAATLDEEGERYVIFRHRARPPLRGFGAGQWPCFVRERSGWSRVGRASGE